MPTTSNQRKSMFIRGQKHSADFHGNFMVIVGFNRRNNWRNIRSWERKVSLLHWRCLLSGLAQRCARTPAPIWLSLTAHPRRLTIMRPHRRALSYIFRQFVSASSWAQRLAVIMVRDLATTAIATTVAVLIGADIAITGINPPLCRGGCVSRAAQMKSEAVSLKDLPPPFPF